MKITNLSQFEAFLRTRIPTREALFMGDIGIKRAKYFMRLLGNPQNKLKVIHIAGTSGKGSTAYLTSHILQSQGFKVGLSISPHVFDIRERMQINCDLVPEKTVLKYFNQILPIILKMEKTKYGSPTFFEINVGLAYYMFHKEKVDYAVMETGLGGRLDATNTVSSKNKICLITKIGLDHTEILGNTVSKIASEKAGIIQNKNLVINHWSLVTGRNIIRNKCQEKNAQLFFIGKKNYSIISSTPTETVFDFHYVISTKAACLSGRQGIQLLLNSQDINYSWIPSQAGNDKGFSLSLKKIELGLIGKHQAENCSLALSCLAILSKRDKFTIDEKLLRNMLRSIKIPGRMESRIIDGREFIFDGAHNPQKMQTFIKNLSFIYPVKSSSPNETHEAKKQRSNFTEQASLPKTKFNRVNPNQKFIFCVAFKKGKDYKNMLKEIIPVAEKIYLSSFSLSNQDNIHSSVDNEEISKFLLQKNFHNFEIIQHSHILENVRMLSNDNKKPIIITGSLYFIENISNMNMQG